MRYNLEISVSNEQVLHALKTATRILGDVAADQEWNQELQKAARLLEFVARNLTVAANKPREGDG